MFGVFDKCDRAMHLLFDSVAPVDEAVHPMSGVFDKCDGAMHLLSGVFDKCDGAMHLLFDSVALVDDAVHPMFSAVDKCDILFLLFIGHGADGITIGAIIATLRINA